MSRKISNLHIHITVDCSDEDARPMSAKKKQTDPSQYHLSTVLSAIDILDYLSSNKGPISLTEISDHLCRHKTSVYRLLSTLESRQMIKRDPKGKGYSIGEKLWAMGANAISGLPLMEIAIPLLDKTLDEVQETVFLSLLDGYSVRYLVARHVPTRLQARVAVGTKGPLHATATGKAILAHQDDDFIAQFIKSNLQSFTPKTISDLNDLRSELEVIRQRGYSHTIDEWFEGISGVASAILSHDGKGYAAVGITLPTVRVDSFRLDRLGKIATEVAQEISRLVPNASNGVI